MKTLIVITGPTASGKSELAIEVARRLKTAIISADSRQMFKDIPIGTAAPSQKERAAVPHYFVGTLELGDYYSASLFEEQALSKIASIFVSSDYCVMCGGSMLYIDAVIKGLDELPTISAGVREMVESIYKNEGLEGLLRILEKKDPDYFTCVDKKNHKRVLHAIEIIFQSGKTYTSLRTESTKHRPFRIVEFALSMPREILYRRINSRVNKMIEYGMLEEARRVYPFRHFNSLNTVGFKELFAMFDGLMTQQSAIEKIKKNTRDYARKQLTWLKKRDTTILLDASLSMEILANEVINISTSSKE